MGTDGQLDRAAADRVLRRAGEMVPVAGILNDGLTDSVIVEAAAEVGIPAEITQRAIAYERLGPPAPVRRTDRLAGPAVVEVEREVPGDGARSIANIDAWLVTAHHLRRDRHVANAGEWRRRTDLAGRMQRSVRSVTGEGGLSKTRVVAARSADLPNGRSIVRLAVHRHGARTTALAVGGAIAVVGVAGATAVAAAFAPMAAIGGPVAIVVGGVVAKKGRRDAARDRRELERLADALERDEQPRLLRDDLKARIRRPR